MTDRDGSVVTGRLGYIEVRLHPNGGVTIDGLGGHIHAGHRDHIQPLVDALIGAQLEPLPGTLRRRWRLARGWRYFEVSDRGS